MGVHIAAAVGHHIALGFLHMQEVAVAPLQLLQDAPGPHHVPAKLVHLGQPHHAVDGGAHPFAQVAGVVPAAAHILVLAVVGANAVLQVARREVAGLAGTAALGREILHGRGDDLVQHVHADADGVASKAACGNIVAALFPHLAKVEDHRPAKVPLLGVQPLAQRRPSRGTGHQAKLQLLRQPIPFQHGELGGRRHVSQVVGADACPRIAGKIPSEHVRPELFRVHKSSPPLLKYGLFLGRHSRSVSGAPPLRDT